MARLTKLLTIGGIGAFLAGIGLGSVSLIVMGTILVAIGVIGDRT